MNPVSDPEKEFLLKQFSALRTEIEAKLLEKRNTIRNAIITSGAIFSWLAIQDITSPIYSATLFVPFGISLLFSYCSRAITKDLALIGQFIEGIENRFDMPADLGWERFRKLHPLYNWESLFWGCLCVGNLVFAVAMLSYEYLSRV